MSCQLTRPAHGLGEAGHALDAGHERFGSCIEILRKLTLWVGEHGADEAARESARAVLRHFRGDALRHYEDEEMLVFPRLLERAGSSDWPGVAQLVGLLEADHRRLRNAWAGIAAHIEAIARGEAQRLVAAEVQEFILLLCSHIECERTRLLPLMQRLLHPDDQAEIGAELCVRRACSALV